MHTCFWLPSLGGLFVVIHFYLYLHPALRPPSFEAGLRALPLRSLRKALTLEDVLLKFRLLRTSSNTNGLPSSKPGEVEFREGLASDISKKLSDLAPFGPELERACLSS